MKVYLSSTFHDLADHRQAVDRALRRMGHDVIGMEQYVAEGSKPLSRCQADVRAADAYVISSLGNTDMFPKILPILYSAP